jgi:hypothetical protein
LRLPAFAFRVIAQVMLWQHELNTKLTEHAIPLYLPFNLDLIPPGGVLLQGVVVFHLAVYENEWGRLQFIPPASHEAIGSDHGADENAVLRLFTAR